MRRLVLFAGLLFAAAVALVWWRLHQLDLSGREAQAAGFVSHLLGREVAIGGGLQLGLSWRPELVAEDVRIANAPWGSRPTMVELERIEIGLELWPLLFDRWDVARVVLVGGRLLIETDREGRSNWEFGDDRTEQIRDEAQDAVENTPDIVADEVWIERVRLDIRSGRSGRLTTLDLERVRFEAGEPDDPTSFELDGAVDGVAVQGSGGGASVVDLIFDRSFPLHITARVAGAELEATGHVESVRRTDGLELEVSARGPELDALPGLHALPELGAFDGKARLVGRGDWLRLEPIDLRVGGSDVAGSLELRPGRTPRIRAQLRSGTIDLGPWLEEERDESEARPKKKTAKVFPDASLGLGEISAVPVDLVLDAEHLEARSARLDVTHAELGLDRGKLHLTPLRARFEGAAIELNLEVDDATRTPRLSLRVLAQDVNLGELLRRMEVTDELKALVDVGIHVTGAGDSVASIMGSLNGEAALAVSEGEIPTRWVDVAVADLAKLLTAWARPPRTTEIECGVVQFQLTDGVAHTQVLLFDTERMTLSGKGDIDLRKEKLHMELAPRPRDKRLLSLATDVRLGGTLASPSAHPHAIGVADTLVRFLLNPAKILVPFDLLGLRKQHACIDDVQKIGREDPPES